MNTTTVPPRPNASSPISAAVFGGAGSGFQVEQLDLEAPRAGEVRVRIEAAGICHSDHHYLVGDIPCPLPIVLGHEGAGTVTAIGDGVSSVEVGQRVGLLWRPRCGRCEFCLRGNPVLCVGGRIQAATGGLVTGGTRLSRTNGEPVHHFLGVSCFAEEAVVAENSVIAVPDGVPPAVAAIAGCAVITGVGAVLNNVTETPGSSILIYGAGGVGLSAVMGARIAGAARIVVVDLDDARLELATRLGATEVVNAASADPLAAVHAVDPEGVDWAIEAIGNSTCMSRAISALRPGGTLVAVGLSKGDATFAVPVNELVQRQKRVVGSLYGSANPAVDLPKIFRLYLSGQLPLDLLLGARYDLTQLDQAYDDLISGAVGRGIVEMPA